MATDPGVVAPVYGVLSRLYAPPHEMLAREDLRASLRDATATLGLGWAAGAMGELESCLAGPVDATELAREYVRLFRGPVRAAAYPYGSIYLDGEVMGPSTMAAVERYREAGLAVSGAFRDLPDHVSTELEFMYYLSSMEERCLAEGDEAGGLRLGALRESFLREHLARWVPGFAARVIDNTTSPFYRALAAATRELVSHPS